MEEVTLRDEFIKLGQVIKLVGIAEDGVEAKEIIANGKAKVNGEVDLRRGRKLYDGDIVDCMGRQIKIVKP